MYTVRMPLAGKSLHENSGEKLCNSGIGYTVAIQLLFQHPLSRRCLHWEMIMLPSVREIALLGDDYVTLHLGDVYVTLHLGDV
jgi:hypothetical protein